MRPTNPKLLLATVILAALLLRLWGINSDLPYIYHHPDEPLPIALSQRMLKTGDMNPHFFHWPSLLFYLNLLAYVPYYLFGKSLGVFQSPRNILAPVQLTMGVTYAPMPTAVLLGRLVTVIFGVGSVLLVFLIGKRLTDRTWVGLLASLFMAVSPTNVWHSHWIAPDTFATFFILAGVLASVRVFQEGKAWQYVLAGACVGLAASSKYNGALVVIPLLVAHFVRYGRSGFKERNLYLALVLSGLTFLMTTPFAILDFPKFFTDLQFDRQHYSTGHAGMEGDTLLWYLAYLWKTSGPIFLVAFIAILYGISTRSREIVILSAFPFVYFVFISRFVVRNDRTLLPLTPFLFLLASALLVLLVERAIRLGSRPWKVTSILILSALAITGLGISARKTASLGIQLNTVTSRETARVWIEDHLPPGASIAIEAYAPFVDPDRFSVQGFTQMIDHEPVWYRDQGFQYLVFGQGMYGRFFADPDRYADEVSQYSEFFVQFHLVREFSDGGYEVRIYRVP